MSGASERANGRASGPVLQSVFLAVIDHSEAPFSGFARPQAILVSLCLADLLIASVNPQVCFLKRTGECVQQV